MILWPFCPFLSQKSKFVVFQNKKSAIESKINNENGDKYARFHYQLDENAAKRDLIDHQYQKFAANENGNQLSINGKSVVPVRAPARPSPYQPRVHQAGTPRSSRINVVEEYINRRKEAEMYKERGRGVSPFHHHFTPASRPPLARRDEQSVYELKHIDPFL